MQIENWGGVELSATRSEIFNFQSRSHCREHGPAMARRGLRALPGDGAQRGGAAFAGFEAKGVEDGKDEDFAVTGVAGVTG